MKYRCCTVDKDGQTFAVDQIECADEQSVLRHAEALLARGNPEAIEVWDGPCKIFTLLKPRPESGPIPREKQAL